MSDRRPTPFRLPRRDLILIPLLSFATVFLLLVGAELVSRILFVESGAETCNAPADGGPPRMRANCVSHRKAAEGPEVENIFNDCGYRTPTSCGPRTPGTLRVVLMGASTAEGFKVRYPDSFAARLTDALTAACHRPVEFQNMGVAGASPLDVYHRMGEALGLQPDLIMLVVGPYELKTRLTREQMVHRDDPTQPMAARPDTPSSPPDRSLIAHLSDLVANSRALVAAQHYLYQDRASFVRLYMLHGEDADYLRPPLSAAWRERLGDFEQLLGDMATRAGQVPMLLVTGPQRIQAALLIKDDAAQGADPFVIDHAFADIASRHRVAFVDTLDTFALHRDPERYFYPVDGHMDATGSAVFAEAVAERLLAGDLAPFAGCDRASLAQRLADTR